MTLLKLLEYFWPLEFIDSFPPSGDHYIFCRGCVGGCLCLSSLHSQWEYSLRSPPARGHICIWWIAVISDSLWPHGLKHTRLPCPTPTSRSCSNSCPSSWWCHQTISYSVISFSSCPQSFPASGSFPVSQFFP